MSSEVLSASEETPTAVNVGVINPYTLVQSLTGKKFDWTKPESTQVLSDVLETDYAELFDMKFNSPLYAGLKLNPTTQTAELVKASDLKILTPADRVTAPLNTIKKLGDLKNVGVKDLDNLPVKEASVHNGKLTLILDAPESLYKKITNTALTKEIFDLVIPKPARAPGWTPPGATWRDMGDFFKDVTEFNDPIQGAVPNCYLISALSAVAWADPYSIMHRNRPTSPGEIDRLDAIQFYSKGGSHDAPTALVEVTDKTLVDRVNNPIYCRSNDNGEIWPAVYEKGFAKWSTRDTSDMPDIRQTAYGDPGATMAKITNKTVTYYYTNALTADGIMAIIRNNSFGFKTTYPMTAWTPPSGPPFAGSNIVANHAYTILGWAGRGHKSYIVLRNPFGVTEPSGLNTIQGLVSFFDGTFWRPINTAPNDGVFALEVGSFKVFYSTFAIAK